MTSSLPELTAAIDRLLGLPASGVLLGLRSNTSERAYEAYTLALCTEAVLRAGGAVTRVGILSGPNPSVLVFRGGPGSLSSRRANYCYMDCALLRKRFEIHVDVLYEGQSGATHEIDVSIITKTHAEDVRGSDTLPRTNKNLIAAIECKFYSSRPGVVLARTFVGLVRDCSSNRFDAFVSNCSAPDLDAFLSMSWAPEPFTDLSPSNPDSEERFIRFLEQALRKWAGGR